MLFTGETVCKAKRHSTLLHIREAARLGIHGLRYRNNLKRQGQASKVSARAVEGLAANSLCRGPEKRTMHEPDVQVGDSGPPLDEEKSNMKMLRAYTMLFAATVVSMGASSLAAPCLAQDANTGKGTSFADAKQVIGLEGLKHNVKGTLVAENGSLVFTKGKKKVVVPAASIQEVMTGKDTERAIGGTVGTLTMFAAYGGGRVLSLFRSKIDTLSIHDLDPSGGMPGASFTLPQGNALSANNALLSQGAKSSFPVEMEAEAQAKPKEKKQ